MNNRFISLAFITAFLPITANAQLGAYVQVAKADQTGTEYFVDTGSIRNYGTERMAVIKEMKPDVWYNKITRDVIDQYDAKLLVEGFNCSNRTVSLYESSQIDKSGQLIKTEYKFSFGDNRVIASPAKPGTINETLLEFVCKARVTSDMSGNAPTSESKIIKWDNSPEEIANLGPDAGNKYSVYLYKKSVKRQGKFLAYVTKLEYAEPFISNGLPIKSVIQESVFNCSNSKFQTLKTELIGPTGQLSGEQRMDPEFAPWDPAPKGSFADRIASVYCK